MMKYYPDIGKALSDLTKGMIATEIIFSILFNYLRQPKIITISRAKIDKLIR